MRGATTKIQSDLNAKSRTLSKLLQIALNRILEFLFGWLLTLFVPVGISRSDSISFYDIR